MRRARLLALVAAPTVLIGTVVAATALPAAAADPVTYQAESAVLSGGAVAATDHTGYTGTGFAGGYTDANRGAASTAFSVPAATAGTYSVALRYANGTTAAMTLTLAVDGATRQISLPATANWDTWGTRADSVTLSAGAHTVAYQFGTGDSGNVNLDAITVTPPGAAAPAGTLEAESAELAGGAAAESDHAGYTGSGFVGGFTDGNRGNARVTFRPGAAAGTATLALRYANGTGSARTLSLYVDGTRTGQVSLPSTANWDSWATRTDTVAVPAGATISYRFDTADSGNVNLDNLAVSVTTGGGGGGGPVPPGQRYETETAFQAGGATVATATPGWTGTGYVTGLATAGAQVAVSVAATAGSATVSPRYTNTTGTTQTLTVLVNDLPSGQLALPAGNGWLYTGQTLTLRAGLNTITYRHSTSDSGNVDLDNVVVSTGRALAARGATLPYTEYEAEAGSTNATRLGPSTTYLTTASEASGRQAVRLSSTGQYVRVTLTAPANSVVVRYSIPDNAAGTGQTAPLSLYAGSTKIASLSLDSVYSWVYGAYPYTNVPSQGQPHHFFQETRALIAAQPAGTVLSLQKDAGDTAAYYDIDLIDTEQVAAAATMPAGWVSATSYGATPDNGTDDSAALDSAIAAARSAGTGLWLPAGTYDISRRINVAGVRIRGAGPWYTTLRGANGKGGLFATGSDVHIADLRILGDVRYRDDANFDTGIEGNFGTGSSVQNVWIEKTKVGMWIDSGTRGLLVTGVRIRDTFADGVNIHSDVQDTQLVQSSVRNTGDDGLAMFSESAPVTRTAYRFVTVQLPMLANAVGIYGGNGNSVTDSLLSDTVVASAGVAVSTRFGQPFTGPTSVLRDTLTRTGGYEVNWQKQLPALWIYADLSDITTPVIVRDVTITAATYEAVWFSNIFGSGRRITGAELDHVAINGAGTYGLQASNVTGSATVSYVTVTGAASGGASLAPGFTLIRGEGNSGF